MTHRYINWVSLKGIYNLSVLHATELAAKDIVMPQDVWMIGIVYHVKVPENTM